MSPLVKTIATIVGLNATLIAILLLSALANTLINSEEILFAFVGLMTYAVLATTLILSGYGIFKLWSQSE